MGLSSLEGAELLQGAEETVAARPYLVAGLEQPPVSGDGPVEAVEHRRVGRDLGEQRPPLLPDTGGYCNNKIDFNLRGFP